MRAVGAEGQHHRFVVDEQRIRRGVVGAQALAIKVTWVSSSNIKRTAVQEDVAVDALNAQAAQTAQQQPHPLHHQLGVAQALNDDVALQGAFTHWALHIHRCGPGVGGPEQLQGSQGGHQFHDRGRVARLFAQVVQARAAGGLLRGLRIHDPHTHGLRRHLSALQRAHHLLGQRLGTDLGARSQQHTRQTSNNKGQDGAHGKDANSKEQIALGAQR